MPLVALGPFTRQVDAAGDGGMTLTIPSVEAGDLLVAVAFRHTMYATTGHGLDWGPDPTGWFRVGTVANSGGIGAGRTPRMMLRAWATLAPAGATVDVEWVANDTQLADSRIGDVGVVAAYRPGPADHEIIGTLGSQAVTFTNPNEGDSPAWDWTATIPGIALCASGLSGGTGPYSALDMSGFTLRGSDVDTALRPELHISDITHGVGTFPGPQWSAPRHHTQLVIGGIPVARRRGGRHLGLVRGSRGVG